MTCSDREGAYRRKRAAELGMCSTPGFAWFTGNLRFIGNRFIRLRDLTVRVEGEEYGPFATMEEAANMLILLGGGPK